MTNKHMGNRIARTKVVEGLVLPVVIHNSSYFFINMPVYADGLVDCWGMVDLPLFRDKLRRGWVVGSVPDGCDISIHGLGAWTVCKGQWHLQTEELYKSVTESIRTLNPTLANLHDCHGQTSHKVGKVNVATLSSGDSHPIRQEMPESYFSKSLRGSSLSIFVSKPQGGVYLADLRVFIDGSVELGRMPSTELLTIDLLAQAVESGHLRRSASVIG
jgi:hypothetical protein